MTGPGPELREQLRRGLIGAGLATDPQAIARLEAYTGILLQEAIPQGFLGPREADRVLPRHVLESAALAPLLPDSDVPPGAGHGSADRAPIVDIGSGAGLPGLVLACLGWRVTLVESLEKRATFLRDVIRRLDVRADVRHARAEDAGRSDLRESARAVLARALAEPAVALELCLPFARVGGTVLIPATHDPTSDERLHRVAEALGGAPPRWKELSVPGADPQRCVMIVDKSHPTAERYPRRPGVPKRRPLG